MNSRVKSGFTPLHSVACSGKTEDAKFLLNAGAKLDAIDADGTTPLHLAFINNNHHLVELMLKKYNSYTIGVKNLVDKMNISYFHIVCSQDDCAILNKYLRQRVDINACISSSSNYLPGCTPLHVAVQFRCKNTIKWLLRHGADITKCDKAGFTPVHQAFWKKKYDLLDLFIHEMLKVGVCENSVEKDGVSFFHMCCSRDNPDVIQQFINSGVDINMRIMSWSNMLAGCTPLLVATKFEQLGNVNVLLKNQADMYAADINGETSLHYVCKWNHDKIEALLEAFQNIFKNKYAMIMLQDHLEKSIQILKLFLDLGVNVDIPDSSNLIPMFYLFHNDFEDALSNRFLQFDRWIIRMIMNYRVMMFKMMAKLKSVFELQDKYKFNLLHCLAKSFNYQFVDNQEELVSLILQNDEDVDALNCQGETALYMAADKGNENLVRILLEKNANVNIFVERQALSTPLAAAVECMMYRSNKPNNVNKLIKHGADVNVILANGSTVLHQILGSGEFTELNKHIPLPVAICDLDIQERDTGQTVLHIATRKGDADTVDWLLRGGAKIDVKDLQNFDPIEYCALAPEKTGHAYYNYFQRMQLIGYKFSTSLKRLVARVENVGKENCFLHQQQYFEELERLKGCVINQYCTLYTFLFQSIQEMAYFMNNEKARALLSDSKLCEHFPQYGPLIASKYRKALARHQILKQSVYSFGLLTKFALPETVVDIVLGFLENADVMKIITITMNRAQPTK